MLRRTETSSRSAIEPAPEIDIDVDWLIKASHSDLCFSAIIKAVRNEAANMLSDIASIYGSRRMARALLLKLSNVILLRIEYTRRHSRLVTRPIALIVDPANSCQLKCPGCIHSGNGDGLRLWDKEVLDVSQFSFLVKEFGPYAFHCIFYNWGEPLINKNLPELIEMSRRYFMNSHISTNLSLSFDVDRLVRSGLPWMTVSIDGASQSTLEVYRRGARINRILDNLAELVETKRRLGSYTPFIDWQYLMFDHNIGELGEAEKLAKEIGVNQIRFCRPYEFSDPVITMNKIPEERSMIFDYNIAELRKSASGMVANLSDDIDAAFEQFLELDIDADYDSQIKSNNRCLWLYEQTVMDANGRFLPCCGPPSNDSWIFGQIDRPGQFNSESYAAARQLDPGKITACHTCPVVDKPNSPNHTSEIHVSQYLDILDWKATIPAQRLHPFWAATRVQ